MTARSDKTHALADDRAPIHSAERPDCVVNQACQAAIAGRRAARTIAKWSALLGLTESELQILWCVREAAHPVIDQTALATALAFSPAQVSACVEKMRGRGLISQREVPGDRRRRLWQLSSGGCVLLEQLAQVASKIGPDESQTTTAVSASFVPREAAA